MKKNNKVILEKIIAYTIEISDYVKEYSYENFNSDLKTYRAVTMCLGQIGELAKHLDSNIIDEYKNIDWTNIRGLRNRLIHDYGGIDDKMIWKVIKIDIPKLQKDIEIILNTTKDQSSTTNFDM